MAFATKKEALAWAKDHLEPTKYGNFFDPIDWTETRPVKTAPGVWGFELRDDCWIDSIERLTK